jgi:GT2 family glycosyltransferase
MTGSAVAIVFSKDRALQLDGTLRSFQRHLEDLDGSGITVLHTSSSPVHRAAYRVLEQEHPGVRFVAETAFRADLLRLLQAAEHVLFLVDDTLFTAKFSLRQQLALLASRPRAIGFSLRLGRNTTYCYPQDIPQALPQFISVSPTVLSYRWPGAEADFGYPLELSSSLYRAGDLLPLLDRLEFSDPNTLESALAARASEYATTRDEILCYESSVAFSAPVNLVQDAWRNRSGGRIRDSADSLVVRFLRGERITVEAYDGLVPRACHEEVDLLTAPDPRIPAVSIVIPCYRQAAFLADAVESVTRQTFTDWEIIVVDDGSPDDTAEVAARLITTHAGSRIRLIRQPNGGVAAARNAGVRAARGRYILPLDADDMIAPTMLEEAVEVLDSRPDVAIVYTDLQRFGAATERIIASDLDPIILPEANQLNYCALYRREVWESVGGYDPEMVHGHEDWDFWVGAIERGYGAVRIPAALFLYRIGPGVRSADALAHDRELRAIMRRNHPTTYVWHRRLWRRARRKARRWRERVWARAAGR